MRRARLLVCAVYALAFAAAVWVVAVWRPAAHPLVLTAGADLAATFVVFAASFLFANSSFYDPYWSVAPIVIAAYWALLPSPAPLVRKVLVVGLVAAWGVRLTYNWLRGWRGLHHEDWRYIDLKIQTGRAYWLVSLLGIHLFPTVIVFLGCLSLWVALAGGAHPVGALDYVAALVVGAAIWIEARADHELHAFRASDPPPGAVLTSGIWSWSRHPNYFGEMTFWWGLWLFAVAAQRSAAWWTAIGPLAITAMFVTVSLPMMERRMRERRPDYVAYAARTPLVVPRPPRGRTAQS